MANNNLKHIRLSSPPEPPSRLEAFKYQGNSSRSTKGVLKLALPGAVEAALQRMSRTSSPPPPLDDDPPTPPPPMSRHHVPKMTTEDIGLYFRKPTVTEGGVEDGSNAAPALAASPPIDRSNTDASSPSASERLLSKMATNTPELAPVPASIPAATPSVEISTLFTALNGRLPITMSEEQATAFNKYTRGENLFITGPGGSGKTKLIQSIYDHAIGHGKHIAVTALTGCAAMLLNCNARTLHGWAGIGLGNAPVDTLADKIIKHPKLRAQWRTVSILVVDEISMMSLKLFNLLNDLGRIVRKNPRPFGGIQVIFSGDFFQLPPVGNNSDPESRQFCFESADWGITFRPENCVRLVHIFRQSDQTYSGVLNQVREGRFKRSAIALLEARVGAVQPEEDCIEPTRLFPTRYMVDKFNQERMQRLDTNAKTFTLMKHKTGALTDKRPSKVHHEFSDQDIMYELEYLANNVHCNQVLHLKEGAQVMCVVNIVGATGAITVCNGSQGIVVGFNDVGGYPMVKFNSSGETMTMSPHSWPSEKIPGVSVSQVPLILSWALTIHKSQGATLECAEIDVGSGVFECGQTYVALSRVKSLEGLYLTSFDPSKILVNKKVQDFYVQTSEEAKEAKDV